MPENKNSLEKTVSISNGVFRLGAYVVTLVGFFVYMHFTLDAHTNDITLIKTEAKEDRKARIELEKTIIGIDAKMDYIIKKLDGLK